MRHWPFFPHAAVPGVIVVVVATMAIAVPRLSTSAAEAGASLAEPPTDVHPLTASALLATAAPLDHSPLRGYYATASEAASRANTLIQEIPLPPGANRTLQVNWAAQGPMSDGDMRFLLQFRAICDWVRAAESRELNEELVPVLDHIPEWPALRGSSIAKVVRDISQAYKAGDIGAAASFTSRNCRERP
jgi:hypothetical protein